MKRAKAIRWAFEELFDSKIWSHDNDTEEWSVVKVPVIDRLQGFFKCMKIALEGQWHEIRRENKDGWRTRETN